MSIQETKRRITLKNNDIIKLINDNQRICRLSFFFLLYIIRARSDSLFFYSTRLRFHSIIKSILAKNHPVDEIRLLFDFCSSRTAEKKSSRIRLSTLSTQKIIRLHFFAARFSFAEHLFFFSFHSMAIQPTFRTAENFFLS